MKTNDKQQKPTHCNRCGCDISLSTALTAEGKDYLYHFCGKTCYEQWQQQQAQHKKSEGNS